LFPGRVGVGGESRAEKGRGGNRSRGGAREKRGKKGREVGYRKWGR